MVKRITASVIPIGYKAAACHAGIKKRHPDLALIVSEMPATAVSLFTVNRFKAAPVILTKRYINAKKHRAVIINSGNANCLTGKEGIADAEVIAKDVAVLIGCSQKEVLTCSTGIIGKRLPVRKIKRALPSLIVGLSADKFDKAAEAVMTTDTFKKTAGTSFKTGSRQINIFGIAKGAGMIAPSLATMLCIIITDAEIEKALLRRALKEAVDNSFNNITIDGDMSTNDTVLLLANGLSGVDAGSSISIYKKFLSALKAVCLQLALMIVKDGEGATKFIEVEVKNARRKSDAKRAALTIANSNLFKTMCFGENPNFGRVAAACGACLKNLNPDKVDIYLNGNIAVKSGVAVSRELPQKIFREKCIKVLVNLNAGSSCAKIFSSDLSPQYVKINASYS